MADSTMPRPARARIRTLLIWLCVLALGLFVFVDAGPKVEHVRYSVFRERLEAGEIESVTFRGQEQLTFSLKSPQGDSAEATAASTRLPPGASESLLAQLEAAGIPIDVEPERRSFARLLLELSPLLLLLAFWIWLLRRSSQTPAGLTTFAQSSARERTADTPTVTFADVAGANEAKEDLSEIVEFLKDPARFRKLGGRLPKGVLLVGPPGTGKTLLAKAVAGEAQAAFFSVSASEFVEMIVGVGASRVRDLFRKAKQNAPAIIFIDEIDAVGRQRGSGLGNAHDEREQTLNQLLVEMDGFESSAGVVVLAATNRPDILDPALLRPGRFDRQAVVGLPDRDGRRQILALHAGRIALDPDADLDALARSTAGMSGADLANIVNEAALLAAREGVDSVRTDHLEAARDKIVMGAERRSMVLTEKERRLTAYHEAGHALLALLTPDADPLHKVSIVPRGRALGVTASLPIEDRHSYTKSWIRGQLAILFGGRAAEIIAFGEDNVTTGAASDIRRATDLARAMVTEYGMSDQIGPVAVGDAGEDVFLGRQLATGRHVSEFTARQVDAEVARLLDEAHGRAESVLLEHRDRLTRLAEALLEHETLDGPEVVALVFADREPERKGVLTPVP